MGLFTEYPAIKRGMRELASVKEDRRATLALLDRVRKENGPPDLKSAILRSLGGHHAGNETVEAIGDVLVNDPSWRTRASACVALGSINDDRARQLLDTAAENDSDKRVRENAVFYRTHPGAFDPH